jgi:hypothetical protein
MEGDTEAETVVGLPLVLVATPNLVVEQPDSEGYADQLSYWRPVSPFWG